MKKIFEKNANNIIKKYNEALEESENNIKYYKNKLEALENRKISKMKTCKTCKQPERIYS